LPTWFDTLLRPARARRQRLDLEHERAHLLKQRTVRDYARRFDLPVFVESGTHVGNMVDTYYSLVAKIDKRYVSPAARP